MKSSTLLRAALLVAAVAVLLSFGVLAQAGQEKVEVCHITGTATVNGVPDTPVGHVITIADPAYPAHIDHGDPQNWSMVMLEDGSEVCTPGVSEGCPCFNAQGLEDYFLRVRSEFSSWETYGADGTEAPGCPEQVLLQAKYGEDLRYYLLTNQEEAGPYMCKGTIFYPADMAQDIVNLNLTLQQAEACQETLKQSTIYNNTTIKDDCLPF
jgi:hypothetical protein